MDRHRSEMMPLMRAIGRELERRHGIHRFYDPLDVTRAVAACGYGGETLVCAHAFFCNGQQFREIYNPPTAQDQVKQFVDRTQLLIEMLAHVPDGIQAARATPELLNYAVNRMKTDGWDWDWNLLDWDLTDLFNFFDW